MDQRTPFDAFEPVERDVPAPRTAARRFASAVLLIGLVAAGVGFGYRMGRTEHALPECVPHRLAAVLGAGEAAQRPAPAGPVIYYRDPDGKPLYSAEPKQTPDGRD